MTHFEADIGSLKDTLLEQASRAEAAVARSVRALVERDDELARKVTHDDDAIDQLEKDVDEQAVVLLSRAPLASQLRLILAAIKIAHDLERVGDEATTIARRVIDLNTEPQLKPYVDVPRMAALATSMLADALKAFTEREPARARAVIPRDREVDDLNRQNYRELAGCMIEKPSATTRCLHLMTISKALERIADHAKNIAEDVVYLSEGRDIRHQGGAKAAPVFASGAGGPPAKLPGDGQDSAR